MTAPSLRRDAAENRRRLLEAAAHVFAEHGLDASVEDVARQAGVGMGTLYRRFPTKEALISELVRQLITDLVAVANEALTLNDGTGLEKVLYRTGEINASHRGCLTRLWRDYDTRALSEEFRAAVSELLERAKKRNRIRFDVTATDIDLVFWSIRGVIQMTRGVTDVGWRRHLAIVLAGLRPDREALGEDPLAESDIQRIRDLDTR
ncbi:TetR/AcrR family transcriptional regulator [Rhodococcus globerulus]|uniref:Helix-turn-helix domain-containing protein n=1 Tax=Rhodococcus globerulus TaxID=33008 RepID=A0ABU4C3Q3_RHOGO|nr:helix-turn-helix domain-containing protein [Rhodococcus globerulus]MDV6271130.1 helix-turn-helix domain-containing protein [Rhodococcus globerulus]